MNAEQIPDAVTQINSTLKETLDFIKQAGGATLDFSKEQVPLYIQELLSYNFIMSFSGFIIGLLVLLVSFFISAYIFFTSFKKENFVKDRWNSMSVNEIRVTASAIAGVLSLMIGIPSVTTNLDWVKIKFAPRVYTVEKIQKMLK